MPTAVDSVACSQDQGKANGDWAAFSRDNVLHEQVVGFHQRYGFRCALETGTWKGHTTVALSRIFPAVYTIEVNAERFEANKPRFAEYANIHAFQGESPQVLLTLIERLEFPLFAFLDAHWGENWPLRDELKILLSIRRPKLLLIHDFKVPGRNFGYDRYANQECSLEYIADLLPHDECRYTFNSYAAPQSERRGVIFIEHLLPAG